MIGITALITFYFATFQGMHGSGYAIGVSIEPTENYLLGIQLISSIIIAYFIGPMTVKSIKEGQHWMYVGIKGVLLCWALPWIILSFIATFSDLSWDIIVYNFMVAIIPCMIIGPLVGRTLFKKVQKMRL